VFDDSTFNSRGVNELIAPDHLIQTIWIEKSFALRSLTSPHHLAWRDELSKGPKVPIYNYAVMTQLPGHCDSVLFILRRAHVVKRIVRTTPCGLRS
jgi:hypothetical protein